MANHTQSPRYRIEDRTRSASLHSSSSYIAFVMRSFRLSTFYRRVRRVCNAFRQTFLVSRIIRYTVAVLTFIETGAVAILSLSVVLAAIPLSLLPLCVLSIAAAIDERHFLPHLTGILRGKTLVVVFPDYQDCKKRLPLADLASPDRVVMLVTPSPRRTLGKGFTINARKVSDNCFVAREMFYFSARRRLGRVAKRVIEVY